MRERERERGAWRLRALVKMSLERVCILTAPLISLGFHQTSSRIISLQKQSSELTEKQRNGEDPGIDDKTMRSCSSDCVYQYDYQCEMNTVDFLLQHLS